MAIDIPESMISAGIPVHLVDLSETMSIISKRLTVPEENPLCVVSVNLDHIHHFGDSGRWSGALDHFGQTEFLNLIDGSPIAAQARRTTGRHWPRLAGSDLIEPVLNLASTHNARIGFLGGSLDTQLALRARLSQERPELAVSGWWSPDRSQLSDSGHSTRLAAEIRDAHTDVLIVGLGKPRQELWMSEYGALTGAKVLLGFGAAVDFMAGQVARAPRWASDKGLEWAWRLSREPRRLGRRYLVDGPPSYLALRTKSASFTPSEVPMHRPYLEKLPCPPTMGSFLGPEGVADVAVLVVTYNNANDVARLIQSLREETTDQTIRVVVADNCSKDGTLSELAKHPDVISFSSGGNRGYSGGINAAAGRAGETRHLLILNPDLCVSRGAIGAMLKRMQKAGAGAVVPRLVDSDGVNYPSLRREPSLCRGIGDAVLGSHFPHRPAWLSEMDMDSESYIYAHRVEWATGAALLVRSDVAKALGPWDERYFLYSEETDYFRRLRGTGETIWFEPLAVMTHDQGGSGTSDSQVALMAVNRVRYAAAHHSRPYTLALRAITAAASVARVNQSGHRLASSMLLGFRSWSALPQASMEERAQAPTTDFPSGTVIIPAHNEASVIARTLLPLAARAASGDIEVIVACNGCTDTTAALAAGFPGVAVLDLAKQGKTSALNAADAIATRWPRLYLDADIEITEQAVGDVFEYLARPGTLAARPAFVYDMAGTALWVRSYYRARTRIPSMHAHLWGAGAYAVNAMGHARFQRFPDATADDAFIDSLFEPEERTVLATTPVVVRVPKSVKELNRTLRRIYRGNDDLKSGSSLRSGLRNVLASVTGPLTLFDAGVYASVALSGKLRRGKSLTIDGGWDRDESTRIG